jgi:hypothetical protein
VLDFDGNTRLELSGFNLGTSGNVSFMGVCVIDVINNNIDSLWSVNAAEDFQFNAFDSPNFAAKISSSVAADVSAGGDNKGPSIYGNNFDFDGTKINVYIDGVNRDEVNQYNPKLDSIQVLKAFANRSGGAKPDGAMAEFIIAPLFDETTRQLVEGYFAHKWGLTANLPNGHPYKSGAPVIT